MRMSFQREKVQRVKMQLKYPKSDQECRRRNKRLLKTVSMRSRERVPEPGHARDMPKPRQGLERDHSPACSGGKRGKKAAAA